MNWISVSEKMPPKDNQTVLVASKHYVEPVLGFFDRTNRRWCEQLDDMVIDNVTHWAELPEMPEEALA